MNYMAYPKEKDTPSRLARKQARRSVFITNKKLKKLLRKKLRLERAQTVEE
jgi:hypothetical protein